jgi:dipeptidyl aminopeptidase/acylaminoacyl peptidase
VHVTPDDAPALVIVGDKDELVPPKHGRRIAAAFREKGVPHKLIAFPDAGHDLGGAKNLAIVARAATAWFDQHLNKD